MTATAQTFEARASARGDDAVSGFVQPLANIFNGLPKRIAVHCNHCATPAAGEFPMIANPIDGLLGLMRTLGTGNLYVRVVNWISRHCLVS